MKLIKSVIFIFLLSFTTHAFAKSNEYYKATLVHVLSNCNSDCQELVFKQEVDKAFISLLEAILQQVKWQLSMKENESYD
jgi:hypothetical protein